MKRHLNLALLASLSLVSNDAHPDQHDAAMSLKQAGKIIGLEVILQSALQRYPDGRVLEAELERKPDHYEYEIELVTSSGQVRELEFDAHSGELLNDEEDD